jgi:hypothetical protein
MKSSNFLSLFKKTQEHAPCSWLLIAFTKNMYFTHQDDSTYSEQTLQVTKTTEENDVQINKLAT